MPSLAIPLLSYCCLACATHQETPKLEKPLPMISLTSIEQTFENSSLGGRRGIYSLERKTIYFAQIILDTQFQRAATIVNFGITKENSRDFKQKISNISIWFCAPLDILHPLVLNISPALRFVLHSCGPMTVMNIPLLLKVKRSIY